MAGEGAYVQVFSAALVVLAVISILGAMGVRPSEGFASPPPPPTRASQTEVAQIMRVHESLQIMGGKSEHNPENLWTYFNSGKTRRNLIRGDTELRGNMHVVGDLRVGRNLAIGKTWITEADLLALKRLAASRDRPSRDEDDDKPPAPAAPSAQDAASGGFFGFPLLDGLLPQ